MHLKTLTYTSNRSLVAPCSAVASPQAQLCCWPVTQPLTNAACRGAPAPQLTHTCPAPIARTHSRKQRFICAAGGNSGSDWQTSGSIEEGSSNGISDPGWPTQASEPSTSGSSYSDGMVQPPAWGSAQLGPRPIQASAQAPAPAPTDQFAAFRAFQQLAALQAGCSQSRSRSQARMPNGQGPSNTSGYRGRAADARAANTAANSTNVSGRRIPGPKGDHYEQSAHGNQLSAEEQLALFRRTAVPALRRGWHAKHSMTVEQLHAKIISLSRETCPGPGPLFSLLSLCTSAEHMRLVLDACIAVRAAQARNMQLRPISGPRLALAFTRACMRCDAPDVLASALLRSNEAGLLLSYAGVHEALQHWGTLHELHKVEQVLASMSPGGLPYNTQTAYVAIRSAVNAGRQETAEKLANTFTAAGVRLHPTTLRLLELGRQRSDARSQAVDAIINTASQNGV